MELGYNRRFKRRKDAFKFWRENRTEYGKPGKVEIRYIDTFDLADKCLAGESPVSEPAFEGSGQ